MTEGAFHRLKYKSRRRSIHAEVQNFRKRDHEGQAKRNGYKFLLSAIERLEDEKCLEFQICNDPFGKMGCGAPFRDAHGHILAERGNIFDRSPFESLPKSPRSPSKSSTPSCPTHNNLTS
jgi:hypothetical protein